MTTNLRRTPDANGKDFIILAADDDRLVRHSSYDAACDAAEALSFKNPGKDFRIFAAISDIRAEVVKHKPNSTLYFTTPNGTLLIALQTNADGEIRTGVVGTSDGKAFSITPAWVTSRTDLTPVSDSEIGSVRYLPNLVGMIDLLARENRLAHLVQRSA